MDDELDGLARLRGFLASRELPLPYIPSSLLADVRALDETTFVAGDGGERLVGTYSALQSGEESLAPALAIGLGGRGMQSSTLFYHLALESLLLLVSVAWGQVYGDHEEEVEEARRVFKQIEEFVISAPPLTPHGKRLIVSASANEGTAWLMLNGDARENLLESAAWQNAADLSDALAQIRQL